MLLNTDRFTLCLGRAAQPACLRSPKQSYAINLSQDCTPASERERQAYCRRQVQTAAEAPAVTPRLAAPPAAFRNVVNAGIKKASLPISKVRVVSTQQRLMYSRELQQPASTVATRVIITRIYELCSRLYSSFCILARKPIPAVVSTTKALLQIIVLGILAGAYIAIGALLMLMVGGRCTAIGASDPGLKAIISGLFGLPCGLTMVLVTGSELFTGNTAVVTAAALEKRVSMGSLMKSWFFSYFGNLLGSLLVAWMAVYSGLFVGGQPAIAVATAKTSMAFGPTLMKGLLCNWLVCMAIYLANAADSLSGKAVGVMLCIPAFVAIGLEHSVANMFIIPAGIMAGANVTWADFVLNNLIPVTIGNTIAGTIFVALLLWLCYRE